ncbi:MAG: GH3 auxin-responsive promoter family protein [Flavobacteriales bacterium]|nr:GH3 auxin-responsive promoter family protein [Flavobacteriales bacterium]
MAFVGTILQEVVRLRKTMQFAKSPYAHFTQEKYLQKLLDTAKTTSFGKTYGFNKLLKTKNVRKYFSQNIPAYHYDKINNEWWGYAQQGKENVCWPGKINYFALTSGTSEASSKKVPVSIEMIKAMRKTSMRQVYSLSQIKLPPKFYEKSSLMLGGSTALSKTGHYLEGDLSGILQANLPMWAHMFYKPGKEIALEKDWNKKLNQIMLDANEWDIGLIAGVPAWYQLLFEKITEHYQVENIHQIWPNLNVFIHGGVSFQPYKNSFAKYLGKEITYLETYLASEGFLAYQDAGCKHMKLVLDNGIYFEFVPFNNLNFDEEGQLKELPEIVPIEDVEEYKDYAILISTCAGAWRYLIGDTIQFVSKSNNEIIITGRTKMFLNLCGEHLTVDNMNKAIRLTGEELGIYINEYSVCGVPYKGFFAHHWYIGIEGAYANPLQIKEVLDKNLKKLNDDYSTERSAALKDVLVDVLPIKIFYEWMDKNGKFGAQNKFPRVLKNDRLKDWQNFIKNHLLITHA